MYVCIYIKYIIYIYTQYTYIHMNLSPYGSHQVVQVAFGIINAALAQETNNGVLVHCWGGVNRSAACVVAFLTTQCLGDAGNVGTGWGWRTTWVCRKVRGTQRKIHGHFFKLTRGFWSILFSEPPGLLGIVIAREHTYLPTSGDLANPDGYLTAVKSGCNLWYTKYFPDPLFQHALNMSAYVYVYVRIEL